ncbi:gibberellin 2-beta-dioxygenase 6-like [Juglans microcarpa x Juglans regia]|uniref:gibberellin 2-beta-dioxygenase 6-like n=1 Tax=Juglans microcarpa x Juglans regia TaxID=2249226 RepID=UPI001B7D9D00|nr:gibberellin 2-beta-dioxygenase 6-like [Juglans microcarpa x Juglans regia]
MSELSNSAEVNFESYPPIFRRRPESQNQNFDTAVADAINNVDIPDSDPIPVIDLQCLSLDSLGEACRDWGLFRLVNHGIPPALLSQLQDHASKLFSLSFEFKQSLFGSPLSYFWGTPALTPSGAALLRGPQKSISWVEGFNVPLGPLSQLEPEDPVLASFRLLLEEYGKHLARLATTIFEAMVMKLNLNLEEVKSNLSESTGYVRIYRYPLHSMANSTWGLDAHTDSSVLSILSQYEVGGLEVLKDNKWLQVKPLSNTLLVNLGDMMQAISNDEYKSAEHRVKLNKQKERISICYFVFPDEGSVIRSSKYKPFTYTDFRARVQEELKTLGFKVGLRNFKLTRAS